MTRPTDYEFTFGGAGTQALDARGRFVRVLEATGDVYLKLDGGTELKRVAGQDIDNFEPFRRVEVRSTVAQTVRICVSATRQADDQEAVSVNVSATVAPGNTVTTTADVSVATVTAATVIAARADRLGVLIKSLTGNAAAVRVGEVGAVGAAAGHELEPGDTVFLATTAAVAVYNPHGAAQSFSITEVREV